MKVYVDVIVKSHQNGPYSPHWSAYDVESYYIVGDMIGSGNSQAEAIQSFLSLLDWDSATNGDEANWHVVRSVEVVEERDLQP